MSLWKEMLLGAYYAATLPSRRRAAVERAALRREPVSVLFFHRVADEHPNAWTMPRATFERQIEWIVDNYDVISLEEAQRRISAGTNHWPSVCLTFDDGYAENCDFALPLLLRKKLPFTYFVSTNHLLRQEPFAHDCEECQPLRPNSMSEIVSLAGAGVEIGAHTRSHADLGKSLSLDKLRNEIVGSKQDLEQAIGRQARYFAFPFGLPQNMSQLAWRVAYEAGYQGVCSAYGSYNWPGDDPFHLRRIHADPEMIRLKNWLTIDPRRLGVEEYDPGDYREAPEADPAMEAVH